MNINWRKSRDAVNKKGKKQLIYFNGILIGRLLTNNLINLEFIMSLTKA